MFFSPDYFSPLAEEFILVFPHLNHVVAARGDIVEVVPLLVEIL
jgi:hypothetical protein